MRATLLLSLLSAFGLLSACKQGDLGVKGNVGPEGTDGEDGTDGEEPVEPGPLTLRVDSPESGGFTTASSVTVTGEWSGGKDPRLAVNGTVMNPPEGTFSLDSERNDVAWPDSPLWPILVDASDSRGEWGRGRRTLIAGDSVPGDTPVDDGLVLRLTDNFLAALGPVLTDAVESVDFASTLVGSDPVASLVGIDVYITAIEIGAIIPEFDFTREGLAYSLRAEELMVEIGLDIPFVGMTNAQLFADAVTISGLLIIGVDGDGGLTVSPLETSVDTENIELFGITDYFGLVDTLLGSTLAGQVETLLVDTLGGLLEAQETIRDLAFEGLTIHSDFTSVVPDDNGMNVYARTTIAVDAGGDMPDRLTYAGGFDNPNSANTPEGLPYMAGLFLDDDLISALGAGLIASGLLNQELSGDLGGLSLDTSLLGGFLPGFDTLPAGQPVTLVTRPTAVPCGAVVEDPGIATALHLGGLEIDLVTDTSGDGTEEVAMTLVVDAIAGIAAGEDGALVGVELLASDARLLSTVLGSSPAEVDAGLGNLISVAVPILVGNLLGEALAFDLAGMTLTTLEAAPVGGHGGLYLEVDPSGFSL